jgi:pimeloyl-ACP methyl ester carboxylesterase
VDIRHYYIEQGEGEPLILLHGNGESCDYFQHQMEAFGRHCHVYAMDTRGHGHTPRGTAPFTFRQLSEDLLAFMDRLGLEKAHILGFSDGGNIALRFAITHRKQKFVYIFPTDQYPYKIASKHNVGKFLNQETLAMTGATALACKLGMSVNYLRWTKLEPGKYSVEFVPICENASSHTPEELMERYYALLEQDIKEQPWTYLWTHRRWK